MCLSVCLSVCDRNAIVNPIDFLLHSTAQGVWVGKVLTMWFDSPVGAVVHAPFDLPKYVLGAPPGMIGMCGMRLFERFLRGCLCKEKFSDDCFGLLGGSTSD